MLNRIEQIADGDGDLRVRLDVLSNDELGKLSHAFNRFLDKLQPLIKEVGRVTGEVESSAQSLAGMAAANDRLISSEHAAVDQVSTAATEMSSAVHEVARNAQNAADAARSAVRGEAGLFHRAPNPHPDSSAGPADLEHPQRTPV